MGAGVPASRMFPGRFYRVTYRRDTRETTIQGRYEGREVTADGDQLVLKLQTSRIYVPLKSVVHIEPVEVNRSPAG